MSFRPAPETPGHGVGDDSGRLHEAAGEQGRQREVDRGRVATRIGDVPRRRDLRAVELDHAVGEGVEQLRSRVRRSVPLLVDRAGNPEVGAEIDDVRDLCDHRRRDPL